MWVQRLLGLLNLWFRVFCCPPKGNDHFFLHLLIEFLHHLKYVVDVLLICSPYVFDFLLMGLWETN